MFGACFLETCLKKAAFIWSKNTVKIQIFRNVVTPVHSSYNVVSPVILYSHTSSVIILICRFGAQETLLIIMLKKVVQFNIFVKKLYLFFQDLWWIESSKEHDKCLWSHFWSI